VQTTANAGLPKHGGSRIELLINNRKKERRKKENTKYMDKQ
jgi:hypothetical protein